MGIYTRDDKLPLISGLDNLHPKKEYFGCVIKIFINLAHMVVVHKNSYDSLKSKLWKGNKSEHQIQKDNGLFATYRSFSIYCMDIFF